MSKLTDRECLDAIEQEGLAYFVQHYCDPKDISNKDFKKAVIEARRALDLCEQEVEVMRNGLEVVDD